MKIELGSYDDKEEHDHDFKYEGVEEPVILADVKEGLDVLDNGIKCIDDLQVDKKIKSS